MKNPLAFATIYTEKPKFWNWCPPDRRCPENKRNLKITDAKGRFVSFKNWRAGVLTSK